MRARSWGFHAVAAATIVSGCCATSVHLDQQVMLAFVPHDQLDTTFLTRSDDPMTWNVASRTATAGAGDGVALASDLDGVGRMLVWQQGDSVRLLYGIGDGTWESQIGPLGASFAAAGAPSVAPLGWGPSDSRWMVGLRSPAAAVSLRVYDAGTQLFDEREFGPAQTISTPTARRVLVARSFRKGTPARPQRDLTLLVWQDSFQPTLGALVRFAVADHVYLHVNDGSNVSWTSGTLTVPNLAFRSTLPDDVAVAADGEAFYVAVLRGVDVQTSVLEIARSTDGMEWQAFGTASIPAASKPQRPAIAPVRRTRNGQRITSLLAVVAPAALPSEERAVVAWFDADGTSELLTPGGQGPFAGRWPKFQGAYSLAAVGVIEPEEDALQP